MRCDSGNALLVRKLCEVSRLNGEVLRCCFACAEQERPWAATRDEISAGRRVTVAVGYACDKCYRMSCDVFGYDSFDSFLEAKSSGEITERRMRQVQQNMQTPLSDVSFLPSSVSTSAGMLIEVEHQFRGRTLSSMRQALNQTRLSQRVLQAAPKIQVPSLWDPSKQEDLWLFMDDGSERSADDRIVRAKQFVDLRNQTSHLHRTENTWSGHAHVALQKTQAKHFESEALRHLSSVRSFSGFVEEFGEEARRQRKMAVASGAHIPQVQGRGAEEARLLDEDEEADAHVGSHKVADIDVDLTDAQALRARGGVSNDGDVTAAESASIACDDDITEPMDAQNWNDWWRSKLTVRVVLAGKPKGRTLRAIRERRSALMAHKETRGVGALLGEFSDVLETAHKMRGGKACHEMTDDQLEKCMYSLFSYEPGLLLPADIAQELLARFRDKCVQRKDWPLFVQVMTPWRTAESEGECVTFKWDAPKMCELPRTLAWRMRMYVVSVFDEQLASMIFESEGHSNEVRLLCETITSQYDDIDVLEHDAMVGPILQDSLDTCHGLLTIMEQPFSTEKLSAVETLKSGRCKRASRPQDAVAQALQATPYYKKLFDTYVQSIPIIEDKFADFESHKELVAKPHDIDEHVAAAHASKLKHACEDLASISTQIPVQSLHDFPSQLLLRVKEVHAAAKLIGAQLDASARQALQDMCCSAAIAFPQSSEVASLIEEQASLAQAHTAAGTLAQLRTACDALDLEHITVDEEAKLTEVQNLASQLSPAVVQNVDVLTLVRRTLMTLAKAMINNGGIATLRSACVALLRFLPRDDSLAQLHEVCLSMSTLKETMAAVGEFPAVWSDDVEDNSKGSLKLIRDTKAMLETLPVPDASTDQSAVAVLTSLVAEKTKALDKAKSLVEAAKHAQIAWRDLLLKRSYEHIAGLIYKLGDDKAWVIGRFVKVCVCTC